LTLRRLNPEKRSLPRREDIGSEKRRKKNEE